MCLKVVKNVTELKQILKFKRTKLKNRKRFVVKSSKINWNLMLCCVYIYSFSTKNQKSKSISTENLRLFLNFLLTFSKSKFVWLAFSPSFVDNQLYIIQYSSKSLIKINHKTSISWTFLRLSHNWIYSIRSKIFQFSLIPKQSENSINLQITATTVHLILL